MSRKLSLKFIQKSYWAIFCIILLSATMLAMSGCATISGEEARAAKNERQNKNDNQVKAGKVAPELVGKRQKQQSGGSFADYAKYAENLGDFESTEITEDGRVRRETLTASKNYDCPVDVSTRSEGVINVASDSQLDISLDAGTIQQKDGCSAEKNSTNSTKATSTDFQWKGSREEDGATELSLTRPNGETARYRRVE